MDASQYKPRKRWPLFVGGFFALLVVLYFVISSGWFLRSVVLPQVASKLNSELTADDVSLSPLSSLTLKNVKLTPRGAETLATIGEVRVRYSLFSIIGGTIKVDEATVDSPVITLVEEPDGTSNLSKLLAGLPKSEAKPQTDNAAPPQVAVKGVAIKNASAKLTRKLAGGGTEVSEVTGLNVTLDQLGNGLTGKLTLALDAALRQATNQLALKAAGDFSVGLDAKLLPSAVSGQLKTDLGAAAGAFKDFAGFGLALNTEVTPTELKQLRLGFSQRGQALGEVSLNGPYDTTKREARINYAISGLDKRVLGLVGAASGFGFGDTAISANGRLDLAQFGQLVASFGKVSVNKLSLSTTNGVTPVLDVDLDYKFSVNLNDKTALAEKVDLKVDQGGQPRVRGSLDRPMNIAWDKAAPGFREATFTLTVQDFELSQWRPLAGSIVPAGRLGLNAKVTAERDGRLLKVVLDGGLNGLTGEIAGAKFQNLQVPLSGEATLEDFVSATLEKAEVSVRDGGATILKLTAFANHHQQQKLAGLQAAVDVSLPGVLRIYPVDDVQFSGGSANVSVQVGIRPGATNVTANFTATGLTGTAKGIALKDYQARLQSAIDLGLNSVTLQRLTLAAQSGTTPGGSFDAAGKFDVRANAGEFNFKSVGLNESALAPFLAGALAPNRLVSIAIDADGSGKVDLAGESAVKAQVNVRNLVAEDPAKTLPKEPLQLGVIADASQKGQTLSLQQLKLGLGATARANNELELAGKFDFATNNPAPSTLSIRSTGLDLTPLYNLFAGGGSAGSTPAPAKPATTTPAGDPNQEPAAVNLPLKRLDMDLDIARLYLREVAISNWVTKVKLDNNTVAVEPLSLTLNGAPVRANVKANLGVPGYTYDVNLGATNLPVPPIAKSFLTGPQMDLHGQVNAGVAIKGAGVTGSSLKKNLAGEIAFGATGLDYQVNAVKSPLLKTLIPVLTTVLRLPNVTQSPIDAISANVTAGQGVLRLANTKVSSPAFLAEANGQIELADVLTNSALNLPISLSIPKEGKLDKLPDFLTMRGTLGKPETKIDPIGLAQATTRLPGGLGDAAAKGLNQLGGAVEKATGGLVPNVGGLLTGQKSTNAPATNAPAGGLGGVLGGILGGGKTTNAPAGATNQPKPLNPFDLLKKPEPKK